MRGNGLRIELKGTVQGVGFRPFVYQLAKRLLLKGYVTNSRESVIIEVQGAHTAQQEFLGLLRTTQPKVANITSLVSVAVPFQDFVDFTIRESLSEYGTAENITPDLAICADCKREIASPDDRRFAYPFNNCTQCGPRFTILRALPYDRKNTTMSEFQMCPQCFAEYNDPMSRRFHAQPVSCHDCGPQMRFDGAGAAADADADADALGQAHAALLRGEILAIKGLGGFHLACDAHNPAAVARLRTKKRRDTKPFAIMVKDFAVASELCEISPKESALLESPAAPIVLLARKALPLGTTDDANPRIGLMLAYTPLHVLLFQDGITALIMTSGNISSDPVCFKDEEAFAKLGEIADHFLLHNREIYFRNDDSVVICFEEEAYPIRRSRGFVPIGLQAGVAKRILAYGADLKNTFAITKAGNIYPSHHIGDLENYEAVQGLEDGIAHFEKIFECAPELLACDLHPGYVSTKLALAKEAQSGLPLIHVQHHHAHMVSCMVDHAVTEPVLGLILDGTGYGPDGSIWGGELLQGDATGFQRLGHIAQVQLFGGDLAVREPWRNALAWVLQTYGSGGESAGDASGNASGNASGILEALIAANILPPESTVVARMMQNNPTPLLTSSAGRLFDAVSALLGIRAINTHEAQAAIELEWQAMRAETDGDCNLQGELAEMDVVNGELHPEKFLASMIQAKLAGASVPRLALTFHHALARGLVKLCKQAASDCTKVVLSGGVFQNTLLLRETKRLLQLEGYVVLIHRTIPCNDGGVSVGQCKIADATIIRRKQANH